MSEERKVDVLAVTSLLAPIGFALASWPLLGLEPEPYSLVSLSFGAGAAALVGASIVGARRLRRRRWPHLHRRYQRTSLWTLLLLNLTLLPVLALPDAAEGDWEPVVGPILATLASLYIVSSELRRYREGHR